MLTTAYVYAVPVSTTHVITSSVMGVGATRRFSAVRWGVARSIGAAWVLTIPAAALVQTLEQPLTGLELRGVRHAGEVALALGAGDDLVRALDDVVHPRSHPQSAFFRGVHEHDPGVVVREVLATQGRARAGAGADRRGESARRLREAVVRALQQTHALLNPEQRARLAYLMRSGMLVI